MTDRTLLEGMRTAVEADPANLALRLHYAELLAGADLRDESVRQAAAVLASLLDAGETAFVCGQLVKAADAA